MCLAVVCLEAGFSQIWSHMCIGHLKEELAWAIGKWFHSISNVILLKTVMSLIELTNN